MTKIIIKIVNASIWNAPILIPPVILIGIVIMCVSVPFCVVYYAMMRFSFPYIVVWMSEEKQEQMASLDFKTEQKERIIWCEKNLSNEYWHSSLLERSSAVCFKTREAAMAFKLKWS